jgi:hypothetical protein
MADVKRTGVIGVREGGRRDQRQGGRAGGGAREEGLRQESLPLKR